MADTGAVLRKMLALGSPHFLRTTSGKMYTGRVTEVGDSFVVVCIEESAASQRAGQRSEVSIPIGDVDVQSLGYWHATRRQRASVLLSLSSAELDRARAVMEAFDAVASSHHPTRQSIGLKDGDYCDGWIGGIEGDTVWFWGAVHLLMMRLSR